MEKSEIVRAYLNRGLIRAATLAIRLYQAARLGSLPRCRFVPSCSHYALDAIETFGFFRGIFLTLRRLLRCHPWHPGGWDPVPSSHS